MKAFALLLAASTSLAACFLDIDFDGTSFSCADGKCPDGFLCVEETCIAVSRDGGVDGDGGAGDASPPDGGPVPACADQFGAAPDYMLCAEEPTTCEFFVTSGVATACSDICPEYDAECVNSFDATNGTECTREEPEHLCTVAHQSQICICSRG